VRQSAPCGIAILKNALLQRHGLKSSAGIFGFVRVGKFQMRIQCFTVYTLAFCLYSASKQQGFYFPAALTCPERPPVT
jgi:hypothetical protein